MAFSDITVKQERRLCEVNGKIGYFHCWEHYSRPVEPSPMIGGAPGGVISFVRAIVEFPEGIGYVDPKDLKFRDLEFRYQQARYGDHSICILYEEDSNYD